MKDKLEEQNPKAFAYFSDAELEGEVKRRARLKDCPHEWQKEVEQYCLPHYECVRCARCNTQGRRETATGAIFYRATKGG